MIPAEGGWEGGREVVRGPAAEESALIYSASATY